MTGTPRRRLTRPGDGDPYVHVRTPSRSSWARTSSRRSFFEILPTAVVGKRSRSSRRSGSLNLAIRFSSRRSEEHTSELQSLAYLVCRLLLEKKKKIYMTQFTRVSQ